VQARLEDEAQCLLTIIGPTPEGKKELVGLADGLRESTQSWRELLLDLKRRGLAIGPELAVGDSALGFWKALDEVRPKTRTQRCWVHKTANVLNKLPQGVYGKAKRALQDIWMPRPGRRRRAPSTPSSRRACHDLQAGAGRRETLVSSARSQPVAEGDPRSKIQ
jgi:hypothetical protein